MTPSQKSPPPSAFPHPCGGPSWTFSPTPTSARQSPPTAPSPTMPPPTSKPSASIAPPRWTSRPPSGSPTPRKSTSRQRISFSAAAASQIVPFLTAFPRLRRCFVGGRRRIFTPFHVWSRQKECSVTVINAGPANHAELIRGILTAFSGAFQSRLLSNTIDLYGVRGRGQSRSHPRRVTGRTSRSDDGGSRP